MERNARRRILCAVDDSERAQEAIVVASDLARRLEMPLTLVHVVEEPAGLAFDHAGRMELERRGRLARGAAFLGDLAEARDLPPETERRVESGNAAGTLRRLAAELSVAVVIVASRGRGRIHSVLLGSVTSQLDDLPCPLLVVPPGAAARYRGAVEGDEQTLACAIDGMMESDQLIREVDWLAAELRSRLLIIYADVPGVPLPSRRFATKSADVELRAVHTDLATTLTELADEPTMQMLAITFDSPWQRVASDTGCPVLVVPKRTFMSG